MKRFVIVALLAVVLAPMAEAQHDLSAWFNMRGGNTTVIPWYVYNGPVYIDARYNFDAKDSGAVFIGKAFGDKVKFIPAVGGIVGKYDGISAELNIIGKAWIIDYFTLNQYSYGLGDSPDFVYHYGDFMIPVTENFSVGINEQWYYEKGAHGAFDIGPVVKVKTNDGLYLKGWLATTNTGSHKFMLGFGLSR